MSIEYAIGVFAWMGLGGTVLVAAWVLILVGCKVYIKMMEAIQMAFFASIWPLGLWAAFREARSRKVKYAEGMAYALADRFRKMREHDTYIAERFLNLVDNGPEPKQEDV